MGGIFVDRDNNFLDEKINFILEVLEKIAYGSLTITIDKGEISKIEKEEKFRIK